MPNGRKQRLVDRALPFLIRGRGDVCPAGLADVVDQDVHAAEARHRLFHHAFTASGRRHIRLDVEHRALAPGHASQRG
jgi:hypothetical protein